MAQPAVPSQRYTALPAGSIRLLSIQPSADRDAQIECHLSPARIDEKPYEALSYVWGLDDPIHKILVAGEEMLVRPNLFTALRELRLADEVRTLWVDSICINQDDIAERSQQVKQMDKIYSSAALVVVWLGEGDDETNVALDFIEGLSSLDPDIAQRIVQNEGLSWPQRQKVFEALGMKHGLDNYDQTVAGLVKLMGNTWWTRVWTVQEIVLAKSAVLRRGSKSATWSNLSKLAAFAFEVSHQNTMSLGRPMDEAIFDEVTMQVQRLYVAASGLDNLSYRVSHGVDIFLEQMISSQLLTRQATDPRDMIYALLGLTTKKDAIEIDYAKSKKEVYMSAMKAMFSEDPKGHSPLHFLLESFTARDPDLPSWVPDFGALHAFRTPTLATVGIGMSLVLGSLYNASEGDADWSSPKIIDDEGVLEMEGVLVDEITNMGDFCPRFHSGWEVREAQLRKALDQWRTLVPETEEGYPGGGSVLEGFWRTVTFDLLLTDRDYFAGNPNRRDIRLPKGAAGMPPTTEQEEVEIREGILDAPPPKSVLEKLGERRFFVTKQGYFGLGPSSTEAGDVVCVLRGAFFPTVVRRRADGRYTIVGECFVQGIMDGEMVGCVKSGLALWQMFSFM